MPDVEGSNVRVPVTRKNLRRLRRKQKRPNKRPYW